MDNLFAFSPGASCGSPYSDVTSVSVFSDAMEPVSPDYHIDNLKSQLSVQSSSSCTSGEIPAEDSVPEDNRKALAEYSFYQNLQVGHAGAVQAHLTHLINKYEAGLLGLPSRHTESGSSTPYSDIAKPKKRSREGGVKRPMNAFMCFAKAERGHLMAGQPELHNAKISKHLGEVWKLCPDSLKTPYIELAQWLKELHRKEHPEYKYRPRKRKPSGSTDSKSESSKHNNNNNNSNNNNNIKLLSAAVVAAVVKEFEDEGLLAKPAKRARKSGSKSPRSRGTRKANGHQAAQLVPSSNGVAVPVLNYNTNVVLQPEVNAPMASAAAAVAAVSGASPVVVLEHQHPAAQEDNWHNSPVLVPGSDPVDLSLFEAVDQEFLTSLDNNGVPGLLTDEYGFNISSDKLLQGPQVEAALDGFKGDVDLESLLTTL